MLQVVGVYVICGVLVYIQLILHKACIAVHKTIDHEDTESVQVGAEVIF